MQKERKSRASAKRSRRWPVKTLGITGAIASGKSTVARMAAQVGLGLIDTDQLAREVTRPCRPAYHSIVSRLGERVVNHDGSLDRVRLRNLLLDEPGVKRILEDAIHPRVLELLDHRLGEMDPAAGWVAVEVPLLFEAGWQDFFDSVWVVTAPLEKRIERLKERGLDETTACKWAGTHRAEMARSWGKAVLIENDAGLDSLRAKVQKAAAGL